jgi:hypothetical protein
MDDMYAKDLGIWVYAKDWGFSYQAQKWNGCLLGWSSWGTKLQRLPKQEGN